MEKIWNIRISGITNEEADNVSLDFDFDDDFVDAWVEAQGFEEVNSKQFEKWFATVLRKLLVTLERKHGKYEKIYVRGKFGSVEDMKVGDWMSFYDKRGACMTREVAKIGKTYIETAPLTYKGTVLDGSLRTIGKEIVEILRPY